MKTKVFFLSLLVFIFCLRIFSPAVHSQDLSFGVATTITINEKSVKNGSIVSTSNKGFILAKTLYDPKVVGIVALRPAVAIEDDSAGNPNRFPIVNSGKTLVLVSTVNGNISTGDLITSSAIPGVGMKSTKSGFTVGTALEKFTSTKPEQIKPIQVALTMRYSAPRATLSRNLFDVANLSAMAWTEEPLTVFRYLLAALVLILSFILGFIAFGRTAGKGVEALGRNPLAARVIQLGIALNVIITVAIIAAGILIAILILTI
ncbi:hypothetical protein A2963_02770 [Candidatus Roizmanbacteria bacterium RIFCSPLOWO2_01_FULL_40_13]|nr:MAG: hypothetical protein A2963_02770 [Candidatus Roizmanbacteria bacterium RIFCSPLOWO2_01_FULL_40_13]